MTQAVRHDVTLLSDQDLFLFNEGSHFRLSHRLGSHAMTVDGVRGTYFAVWAPNADRVDAIGDFNGWTPGAHPLRARGASGIWEGFAPGIDEGAMYKYHIISRYGDRSEKADPLAFRQETPPGTASRVWRLDYDWKDEIWLGVRRRVNTHGAPIAVYEVHLGSWMRVPEEGGRWLTYREIAPKLADYVVRLGFTHVELLPVMEHPFYGSWGYQVTGYFAPSGRYGSPQDFMFLIDYLHQRHIGVILDWVPSHFPTDAHGLAFFDGTHLYEHADPRRGLHPDWNSFIFNYGRHEVQSFLISNALFWLDAYHVDGLRVDAVASMLHLNFSREPGEWIPNQYGGEENIEAIAFLRRLTDAVRAQFPDVQVVAEESSAWPLVTRPTYVGGLGFDMKWDLGWMHDTLEYLAGDPIHRKNHHTELTFRMFYAFTVNFVLTLSHDEVVHGKGALLARMPGSLWERFANLRLLLGYMYAQPGKKLLFMGGEFGQWREWNHDQSLDWHLLEHPAHAGVQKWVTDLNHVYRTEPAMHEQDFHPSGFAWVDPNDAEKSIFSFVRRGHSTDSLVLVVFNCTPVPRYAYLVGVPRAGWWREILNSDAEEYGGSGQGNMGGVEAAPVPRHGQPYSLALTLPPLSGVFFKHGT